MTYLITTSLKEFWPDQGITVLMGPWCLPAFGHNQGDEIHQGQMLPSPWPGIVELKQAYATLNETYYALLPKLCHALNKVHGTSYSDRYWQILVGPWLILFVHVIYDKFERLELARKLYSDLKLIGLASHSFEVSIDTIDFAHRINYDDLYNFQLITRLAENMGIEIETFREQKINLTTAVPQSDSRSKSTKLRIYEYIQKKLLSCAKTVVYKSGHPRLFLAKLFILSKGNVIDLPSSSSTVPLSVNLDITQRNNLKHILLNSNLSTSLEVAIGKMISEGIPRAFLEGYPQLEALATLQFGFSTPKVICSAIGWCFDEPFKCWGAKAANQGVKLWGMQHGGNYGIVSFLPYEEHERSITDKYLTWGWSERKSKKDMVPLPAQKLLEVPPRNYTKEKNTTILFTATAGSRYLIQFTLIPDHFQNYVGWQKRFFVTLSKTTLSLTRVRLHREDNIWEIHKRLEQTFPELTFEGWDRGFWESLSDCRLFVCDHLSTTYAEALASNTPTVIFWDPQVNQMRPEAQEFFDDFRRVGILHDTPESAAAWVEKVYPDVLGWWNKEECQQAVGNFCHNYARVSNSPLREWLDALNKIID